MSAKPVETDDDTNALPGPFEDVPHYAKDLLGFLNKNESNRYNAKAILSRIHTSETLVIKRTIREDKLSTKGYMIFKEFASPTLLTTNRVYSNEPTYFTPTKKH